MRRAKLHLLKEGEERRAGSTGGRGSWKMVLSDLCVLGTEI